MNSDQAILIDDETTWPPAAHEVLAKHADLLSYCPDSEGGGFLLKKLSAALARTYVLGWHCTRLHEDEITDVRRNGLEPLSHELIHRRVKRMEAAGELSATDAQVLLAENQINEPYRSGCLSFTLTQRTLMDEGAVAWLLSCWGGEAVYNSHVEDGRMNAVLRKIGMPCILEAALPVHDVTSSGASVVHQFLKTYRERRGTTARSAAARMIRSVTACVRRTVDPRKLRIITRADAEFESLTHCGSWRRIWKD